MIDRVRHGWPRSSERPRWAAGSPVPVPSVLRKAHGLASSGCLRSSGPDSSGMACHRRGEPAGALRRQRRYLAVFWRTILLVGAMLASVVLAPVQAFAATSATEPAADTYVQADRPTSNFGRTSTLRADNSPITNAYLRFNVSVPAGEAEQHALPGPTFPHTKL